MKEKNKELSNFITASSYSIEEVIGLRGKLSLCSLGSPYRMPGREPMGLSSSNCCLEMISSCLSSFSKLVILVSLVKVSLNAALSTKLNFVLLLRISCILALRSACSSYVQIV